MRYSPGQNNNLITKISYTNGKEYMLSSGMEYIGYYHIYKNNPFTGQTHENSYPLIKYVSDFNVQKYISFKGINKFKDPIETIIYPTEEDYKKGYFTRYFIKQRNYSKILEIDKNQYNSLSTTKGINENFYKGVELDWKLTGSFNDIYKNGIIKYHGIEDTNKRTVLLKDITLSGLKLFITNYTQFAKVTIIDTNDIIQPKENIYVVERVSEQESNSPVISNIFKEEPWIPDYGWILYDGVWHDEEYWIDTEVWID